MRRLSEVEDELSLEGHVLRGWIEQRWIRPTLNDGEPLFDEADMARARLIAELKQDFNVSDEAMPVVLQLLDQVYALRKALNDGGAYRIFLDRVTGGWFIDAICD